MLETVKKSVQIEYYIVFVATFLLIGLSFGFLDAEFKPYAYRLLDTLYGCFIGINVPKQ